MFDLKHTYTDMSRTYDDDNDNMTTYNSNWGIEHRKHDTKCSKIVSQKLRHFKLKKHHPKSPLGNQLQYIL